jgi:malonyl-CoA O-methyltransferase
MPAELPPTLDPVAVARWRRVAPARSPWLHDEVARRMAARLEWIRLQPQHWVHWEPVRGGLAAHDLLTARYPQAAVTLVEPQQRLREAALSAIARPWWKRWGAPRIEVAGAAPDGAARMLWANMALHLEPQPQTLMARWHAALAAEGFLMFSCLGPDTVRELRALYARLGWPAPGHAFTDMHDWGDMLVGAGFAEPVMDMERITLSWSSARALLDELAGLGGNFHPARFPALRGRGWRAALEQALENGLRGPDGRLALTFEVIYGHALRPTPRVRMDERSAVSLEDMRAMLQAQRPART